MDKQRKLKVKQVVTIDNLSRMEIKNKIKSSNLSLFLNITFNDAANRRPKLSKHTVWI